MVRELLVDGEQGSRRLFAGVVDREGASMRNIRKSGAPLLWNWGMERYVGAAHGSAGVIGVLVNVFKWLSSISVTDDQKEGVEAAINDLRHAITTWTNYAVSKQRLVNGNYSIRVDDHPLSCSQLYPNLEKVGFVHGVGGVGLL